MFRADGQVNLVEARIGTLACDVATITQYGFFRQWWAKPITSLTTARSSTTPNLGPFGENLILLVPDDLLEWPAP